VGNAVIDHLVPASASIGFPADYDANAGDSVLFVGIDSGGNHGDVFAIDNSIATDLNVGSTYGSSNVDVSGLAVSGETSSASLIAGAADSAQVYFSRDGGKNWKRSSKPPTGESATLVVMADGFENSGMAYVATSGSESAVSITQDGGVTWNQVGLIDSAITSIIDLAISPAYSQDDTLFMLSFGGEHSLWRSQNCVCNVTPVFQAQLCQ
jgi:photosystem II stability/assembly factor-like uncharacterized protein